MPRFTGQNKKKINPRYFLNEVGLTEGEVRILEMMLEEGIVDEGFWATLQQNHQMQSSH